jgi:tumor protein p53-inducible protein 3
MSLSSSTHRAAFVRDGAVSIEALPELPAPGPDEVRLRVSWSGVNRADTLQRRGAYAPPPGASPVLGLEAAGVVEAAGENVRSWMGRRAMALLSGGGNAGAVIVRADHCMLVPESLPLRTAAAIPENWITAFQLLFVVAANDDLTSPTAGRLPSLSGATVVIHAAGSGVGTAAVQLAVAAGARVIAVAGSDAKIAAVRALGAAEGVNWREDPSTFSARLKAAVGARGASLILDPVGASFAGANAEALGMDGVWLLYGSMGGLRLAADGPPGAADALLGTLLRKRGALRATTLRNRSDSYKANLVARFSAAALPTLASEGFRVMIDSEFDLNDLADAHALMERNTTLGKIVVRVDSEI